MSARQEIADRLWLSVPSADNAEAKVKAELMLYAYRAEVLAETPADPWQTIAALAVWLDRANGSRPERVALSLLKLSEEAGEVASAYSGMLGSNPRKGVTNGPGAVARELVDVILAAMVALHLFTADPAAFFAERLQRVAERSGAAASKAPGDADAPAGDR